MKKSNRVTTFKKSTIASAIKQVDFNRVAPVVKSNTLSLLTMWLTSLLVFVFLSFSVMSESTAKEEEHQTKVLFSKQVECMTRNIYYESSHEPFEGKLAVAQVTMNRANSGKYPSDVCGVVHQKTGSVCQFSWYCADPSTLQGIDPYKWQESRIIAKAVMYGDLVHPELRNALFFHATYVNPTWNKHMAKVKQIGGHIFYASRTLVS